MTDDATTLLLSLDLLGIAVFAVSGALVAIRKDLDLFGVLTLAIATALGGGLVRDALIGVRPPAAFQDWRYLAVPALVGLVTFFLHRPLERLVAAIRLFDAAGLSLFVVSGTTVALAAGLGAVPAVAMGVLTGVGGGVVRDVLVREIPVVLQRELYAVPALLGAAVVVVPTGWGCPAPRRPRVRRHWCSWFACWRWSSTCTSLERRRPA